jgi:hypothetical protein
VKIDPTTFPSGPVTIDPLPPGILIAPFDPSIVVPLDSSSIYPLVVKPAKNAEEPRGTGKGAGKSNADQEGGIVKPGTPKE